MSQREIKRLSQENKLFRRQLVSTFERLESVIDQLSVIKEMASVLRDVSDFTDTCYSILGIIIHNTLAQNFSIMMLDQKEERLFLVAASDPENQLFIESISNILSEENLRYSFRHGQGIAGSCLETKEAILVDKISRSTLFAELADSPVTIGSLLSVPMLMEGNAVGVLNISHSDPDIFTIEDVRLFTILADFIMRILLSSLDFQRLEKSREHFKVLSELSHDGVVIIQSEKQKWTNHSYQNMTGYSGDELTDILFQNIFTRSGAKATTFSMDTGGLCQGILLRKEGDVLKVHVKASPITYKGKAALLASVRIMP